MGSTAIPIQPPHIDPGLFQRTSGEGSQLEPLIQALQFYKKSKLEEQRNQIDAIRAGSEANLQGAQADTLRRNLQQEQDNEEAWRKQIDGADPVIRPILRLANGMRALDPQLQHVVGGLVAQQMPGVKPEQITNFLGGLRLGVSGDAMGHLLGLNLWDLHDAKNAPPGATLVPKSLLDFHYTPPAGAERERALEQRAQGMLITNANKDDNVVRQDLTKAKQQIAQDAWKTANPKAPAPLVPVQFDPNDPNQVLALHKYVSQHHYDTRLQLNNQRRTAATERIQGTALGDAISPANPTADKLQQVIDLMSQQPDTIPQ